MPLASAVSSRSGAKDADAVGQGLAHRGHEGGLNAVVQKMVDLENAVVFDGRLAHDALHQRGERSVDGDDGGRAHGG